MLFKKISIFSPILINPKNNIKKEQLQNKYLDEFFEKIESNKNLELSKVGEDIVVIVYKTKSEKEDFFDFFDKDLFMCKSLTIKDVQSEDVPSLVESFKSLPVGSFHKSDFKSVKDSILELFL